MGRIRNPLYLHRYLGFEFLSLRHYLKSPVDLRLRGFFVFGFYVTILRKIVPSLRSLWPSAARSVVLRPRGESSRPFVSYGPTGSTLVPVKPYALCPMPYHCYQLSAGGRTTEQQIVYDYKTIRHCCSEYSRSEIMQR